MKKLVVVFGANGFIGSNLANYVIKYKLYNKYDFLFTCNRSFHNIYPELKYEVIDLSNFDLLNEFLVTIKPDFIINLVGVIDNSSLENSIKINADIPRDIIQIVLKNKLLVKNILLIGSASEYGECHNFPIIESELLRPLNYYGLSKVIQTEYFNFFSKKINLNIARTFNVIGPNIPDYLAIGAFVEKIKQCPEGGIIKMGNLTAKRDYLHVDDVLSAFFSILFFGKSGEVYNVCSGVGTSMYEILNSLIKVSGKNINVIIDENIIQSINVPVSYGDNNKLKSHTRWRPIIDLESSYIEFFVNS